MPEERGYDQRVRVQATQTLPGVSADSFGAGVGQAVAQAGAVVQQEQLENARLDRELRDNAEWSAYLVEDAKRRDALTTAAREGRLSDAPGHAARIGAEVDRAAEELTGSLTSERLKQQARARIADWGGTLRTREADYEFVRGQEIAVERFQEQRDIVEGMVRRADDPKVYAHELAFQIDAIAQLNTSDEVKQKLLDETEQRFAVSFLRGMTDRDPQAAMALIDSGAFDGVITGDQVEVLRNGAGVEIRRVEAQREREQTEIKAVLREQVQTFEQAETLGLITEPEQFDAAIGKAQALGDDSLVLKLTGLKANQQFIRVWGPENATALQREQRIATLAGKDKRSPEENLELNFLRDKSGAWASEEARDPVGQAAQRGGTGAPPVVDFADPKSVAARGQWAAARSAEGRRVPAFTATEARELGKLYDSGRQGEEQVLAVLAALPPAQAMESAKQIDPGDRTLPVIATLSPFVRSQARRGREALKAKRTLLSDMMRDDLDLSEAVETQNAAFESAMRVVPPDQRAAIFETAKQIAAGQIDKTGLPLTPALWTESLKFALGGRVVNGQWVGGLGQWNGQTYLLPGGGTEAGFQGAVLREAQTSKDPPVNPDGSTANLFRLTPVAVAPDTYEFRNAAGTPVTRKSGKVYRVVVKPK